MASLLASAGVALASGAGLPQTPRTRVLPAPQQISTQLRFELRVLAPGVYVHAGRQEESTRANLGDIANLALVVGTHCAAVIDSGGSYAVGRAFAEAVRRVTLLPVCALINTHAHPDHVFGNAAFADADAGLRIVGHARLPAALATRGPTYLHALQRELGAAAAGTRIVAPTETVDGTTSIDLGGRRLLLRTWPTAHTDCDLTVWDEASATLFTGDLLFVERMPALDGSLVGWLKVIDELRALHPRHVLPGHGAPDSPWPAALDEEAAYLHLLDREVRAAIAEGRGLREAIASVGVDAPAHWKLAEHYHKRNVTAAYAELEWAQ